LAEVKGLEGIRLLQNNYVVNRKQILNFKNREVILYNQLSFQSSDENSFPSCISILK